MDLSRTFVGSSAVVPAPPTARANGGLQDPRMPKVTLPDGRTLDVPDTATVGDVAAMIGPGLAKAAIAGKVDDDIVDLSRVIGRDCRLKILTLNSEDGDSLYVLRHSTAHVMAEAVCQMFPQTKLVYGPPVENGFFYDIDLDRPITPEDFPEIERRMKDIVAADRPFTRYEMDRPTAMKKLAGENNPYKVDNAERADGDCLSFYVTGDEPGKYFEDLCRGPHVPSTGRIPAFKVLQVSGAFYRGDANEKQLQRVYGTAFAKKSELSAYLEQLEEAKKRDHRVIGKQLSLFATSERVGTGLILWLPKGATLRYTLEQFLRAKLIEYGYEPVYSPHIGKLELYKTSGHFPYYRESQYPPIMFDEHDGYLLRPMNCPHHIEIYAAEPKSYRDLPVRLAEFGTVYRYEQSGEVQGMLRVRGFTQDDAHLFCTPDQLEHELKRTVELTRSVLEAVALENFRVRVGLRDPESDKYIGSAERWAQAEQNLLNVVKTCGLNYTEERGEAAFYGPKIDFVVKDCIGREWQLGTVQVDYNLPERFGLEYIGPDNRPHRPIMIHRAPFGSLERFVGLLIEHFAGAFPLWLAPVQAVVLSVSEKSAAYAEQVAETLKKNGMRIELDTGSEKIGPKKHRARQQKVPYILVVGEQEAADGAVNVNDRDGRSLGTQPIGQFVAAARAEIESRSLKGGEAR